MDNIHSKFKYSIELGVNATKMTFKLKKTTKDRVIHILSFAFIVLMSAVLVWDIVRDASFVLDLIILVILVGMEIFGLILRTKKYIYI